MPMVELENAVVRAHEARILGPISLEIRRGEFWGIVGPNGAGKSTLLRVLAGLQPVSEGNVRFFDQIRELRSRPSRRQIRRKIGIFFQHHDFMPDLPFTVEEIVYFGRTGLAGLGRFFGRKDHDAVEEAIHALQLDPLRHRLYRDLSGGERQKTQLARLLAQGADLFLIDEPAAGLDLDWQERLTQLIEWLYLEKGKTIVVVTHDVDLLPASCKQVILLKEAQAEAVGAPAELFTREILSDLYACEMEVAQRRGRYHAYSTGLGEGDRRDKEAEPWT